MQKRSKFLQAFDIFGMATAVLLVLTWMYGLQARNWYRARELKKSRPAVSLVPQPLPDTSVAREKGITLAAFGYRMDVPWVRMEEHESTAAVSVYLFTGGVGLRFWNPAKISGTVEMMKEAVEGAHRRFTDFLGARTEYEFLDAELKATPEQISPFMKKSDAFRDGLLLNLKWIELEREPAAIYTLALNGLRGFQLGDPGRDRVVEVQSFDASEREFRFLFAVEPGSNVKLDQGEINEVVESVQLAPAAESASSDAR
jgi:hypothetical protein